MTPNDFYEWRKRLDISQSVAAGLIGRSARTVRYWESGAVDIPHWVQSLTETIAARTDLEGTGTFERAGRPVEV